MDSSQLTKLKEEFPLNCLVQCGWDRLRVIDYDEFDKRDLKLEVVGEFCPPVWRQSSSCKRLTEVGPPNPLSVKLMTTEQLNEYAAKYIVKDPVITGSYAWNPCTHGEHALLTLNTMFNLLNREYDGRLLISISHKKDWVVMLHQEYCTPDGYGEGDTLHLAMTRAAVAADLKRVNVVEENPSEDTWNVET